MPSPAFVEMRAFNEHNSNATLMLNAATYDYGSARCLLINGLPGGFPLGAQACEKFLKGFLLLLKESPGDVRRAGHDLKGLLKRAGTLSPGPQLSSSEPLMDRFATYYNSRYPDNPDRPQVMSTTELSEFDEFIMNLNDHLSCPKTVRLRSGFYAAATFSLNPLSKPTPIERWLKCRNRALANRWPRIVSDYHEVMDLHPKNESANR